MIAAILSVFFNSAQRVVLTVCVVAVGFMLWFLAGLLRDAGRVRKRARRFPIITSRAFEGIPPSFQAAHSDNLTAGHRNLERLTARFSSPQKYQGSAKTVSWDRVPGPSRKARSR